MLNFSIDTYNTRYQVNKQNKVLKIKFQDSSGMPLILSDSLCLILAPETLKLKCNTGQEFIE